ncbi:Crp/Fnr family transcriptional regulator [Gemmiger sp. An120]|uniref:Crp/Fnr family transcriptional regulator n=1 Tax=Gemmiger sp. An120 TaxID=1965549 RepID=UPI000B385862|nr:Crp/Fnr family transcriptional regulator [Gemmiger sp. An120]OUQ44323.1 Crp/Fnr family transcriptional regulator [Gemmiger sp. An120]HIX34669.1 Crp/Fnr family transcriptional regulator [Candidatus Gemmiger avium]
MRIRDEQFDMFEAVGQLLHYRAGELIYMQQDSADILYLIRKGRVRVYLSTESGEEVTLEIVEKGRIFGESSFVQDACRPTTVSAVTDTELVACRLSELGPALCGSWELTSALLQMMSDTCDYLSRLVKRAYLYDRRERLAAFLLEQTAVDNPDKGIVDGALPYTHEDLALVVGLSRVTVTRVLGEFQRQGWVECGYRKIRVRDREGLRQALGRFGKSAS